MIHTDSQIQHGLHHLEIWDPVVTNTIKSDRFSVEAIAAFFNSLRSSHAEVLRSHDPALAQIIVGEEHHELGVYGPNGQFADRLSLGERGLMIIEDRLHSGAPPELTTALDDSVRNAVAVLRSY